ncbi:putative Retinal guanylyl cyclase 2 [Hypsibius exemplaris]|uniref:guanylate cyclase n=1 Tax=Hypsibius exemplaris TaxID=2072580 RepID=A0A1W0WV09_HYPEX|nr:putative Retinal guanylyl cyclase 2 [Hypsibius exemplaris]
MASPRFSHVFWKLFISWFNLLIGIANATNVTLLTVHVGANPLYGYYAAAPVYRVAVRHIRQRWPASLGNLTHTAIYLPGYDICPDGGDHTAEFFAGYYYEHLESLTAPGNYLVLASPECSNQALILADFARDLDLPLFISVAGSPLLTSRKRYPTTSPQAALSGTDVLQSLELLLNRFAWRTLSLICDAMTKEPGLGNFFYSRCSELKKFFSSKGYTWYNILFDTSTQRNFAECLSTTKNESRIYIILTTPRFVRHFMIEASKLDMASGDFVFIAIQPTRRPGIGPVTWRGNGTAEDDKKAKEAFKSLLVITGMVPDWRKIWALTSEISETARMDYNYTYSAEAQESDVQIGIYESTMMFAQVFDENYPQVIDMTKKGFIERFFYRSFSFAERNYSCNSEGEKVLPLVVQRFNLDTQLMETALMYDPTKRTFYDDNPELWYWLGRNSSPPDVPQCGFRGDQCDRLSNAGILSGTLITVFIVLLIACSIGLQCVIERRRELRQPWWLIERATIQSATEQKSAQSSNVDCTIGRKCRLLPTQQSCYVLNLETTESLTVFTFHNHKKLLYLLLHGISPASGTLRLLANTESMDTFVPYSMIPVTLPWQQSAVLNVLGLLEATEYLHDRSPLGCHGNLSSLVCIVDARFTAKIAESGYARIFEYLNLSKSKRSNEEAQSNLVEMIWKPPEVLATYGDFNKFYDLSMTSACDIYSIGMIFYEIITGSRPLGVDLDSQTSILATVSQLKQDRGMDISSNHQLPPDLLQLLTSCFGPAESRPTARRLRNLLQRIEKRTDDVIGHILGRIERHAADLELVVAERSQALSVEMAKADSLLEEMLPRLANL